MHPHEPKNFLEAIMEKAKCKLLRIYRQVVHTALNDYPDKNSGRGELRRIRGWVRSDLNWHSLDSLKRSSGILRYCFKELQSTISFSKYRAMKRNYRDD